VTAALDKKLSQQFCIAWLCLCCRQAGSRLFGKPCCAGMLCFLGLRLRAWLCATHLLSQVSQQLGIRLVEQVLKGVKSLELLQRQGVLLRYGDLICELSGTSYCSTQLLKAALIVLCWNISSVCQASIENALRLGIFCYSMVYKTCRLLDCCAMWYATLR